MNTQLNAAQRLVASDDEEGSSYQGTKVRDLQQYVKSLGIRIRNNYGGAGPGAGAGMLNDRVPTQQGYALAQKLVADGWYGVRMKKKFLRSNGEQGEQEYITYYCKDGNITPTPIIKINKPSGDNCVVVLIQTTNQAANANWKKRRSFSRQNPAYKPSIKWFKPVEVKD